MVKQTFFFFFLLFSGFVWLLFFDFILFFNRSGLFLVPRGWR